MSSGQPIPHQYYTQPISQNYGPVMGSQPLPQQSTGQQLIPLIPPLMGVLAQNVPTKYNPQLLQQMAPLVAMAAQTLSQPKSQQYMSAIPGYQMQTTHPLPHQYNQQIPSLMGATGQLLQPNPQMGYPPQQQNMVYQQMPPQMMPSMNPNMTAVYNNQQLFGSRPPILGYGTVVTPQPYNHTLNSRNKTIGLSKKSGSAPDINSANDDQTSNH